MRFLTESRKWKEEIKEVEIKVLELKELVIVYPLPPPKSDELNKLYETTSQTLKTIIGELEQEDRSRMLYTLVKSNSKDSIPYPIFKSKPHEDVHVFIDEFKDTLVRNQIPKKDHVKILRVYLQNFALEIVQESITDIDEAYQILLDQFGSSD